MSDFRDRFERQLITAAREAPVPVVSAPSRRAPWRSAWRRTVLALTLAAVVGGSALALGVLGTRSVGAGDGSSAGGKAVVKVRAVPPEQLALLGVLRRPPEARDRPPQLGAALRFVSSGTVRRDVVRRLDAHGDLPILLIPVRGLPMSRPRHADQMVTIDAALCLYGTAPDDGAPEGGIACFTTRQLRRGEMVGAVRQRTFGLVPDGVAEVALRFRGHRPIRVPVRRNFWEKNVPSPGHPSIARAVLRVDWLDAEGRPVPKR